MTTPDQHTPDANAGADEPPRRAWPKLRPATSSLATIYFVAASLGGSLLGFPGEDALLVDMLLTLATQAGVAMVAIAVTEAVLRRQAGNDDLRAASLAALGGAMLILPWLVPAVSLSPDEAGAFWRGIFGG